MMQPMGHTRPYNGRATAWFVASVSSPITECITGAFPEHRPASIRTKSMTARLFDSPKSIVVIPIPMMPLMMTGRRPILSKCKQVRWKAAAIARNGIPDNLAKLKIENSWAIANELSCWYINNLIHVPDLYMILRLQRDHCKIRYAWDHPWHVNLPCMYWCTGIFGKIWWVLRFV